MKNWKQIFAIKKEREKQIKRLNPTILEKSGIYIFYRNDGEKICVYIGQATKNIVQRCAEHLEGYKTKNPSHIDKSLKKHGLYDKTNQEGWKVDVLCYCEPRNCDDYERHYISHYKSLNYVKIYNITGGSQGKGKVDIQKRNNEKLKRYENGKNKGKIAILRQVKTFFDKYLDFTIKGKTTKIKARKLQEFEELLKGVE